MSLLTIHRVSISFKLAAELVANLWWYSENTRVLSLIFFMYVIWLRRISTTRCYTICDIMFQQLSNCYTQTHDRKSYIYSLNEQSYMCFPWDNRNYTALSEIFSSNWTNLCFLLLFVRSLSIGIFIFLRKTRKKWMTRKNERRNEEGNAES